jgi:hypothetical protein
MTSSGVAAIGNVQSNALFQNLNAVKNDPIFAGSHCVGQEEAST